MIGVIIARQFRLMIKQWTGILQSEIILCELPYDCLGGEYAYVSTLFLTIVSRRSVLWHHF